MALTSQNATTISNSTVAAFQNRHKSPRPTKPNSAAASAYSTSASKFNYSSQQFSKKQQLIPNKNMSATQKKKKVN